MLYTLKEKFKSFMQGRYGTDALNNFLLVLLIACAFLNLFFHIKVIYIIQWCLLIVAFLRAISKNYYKRTKENATFLKLYLPAKSKFKILKRRFRERKYRVYKKCPKCRAVISLPRKKGKHGVRCPKCSHSFKVNIRF